MEVDVLTDNSILEEVNRTIEVDMLTDNSIFEEVHRTIEVRRSRISETFHPQKVQPLPAVG